MERVERVREEILRRMELALTGISKNSAQDDDRNSGECVKNLAIAYRIMSDIKD